MSGSPVGNGAMRPCLGRRLVAEASDLAAGRGMIAGEVGK
jgi:hypothetical protein